MKFSVSTIVLGVFIFIVALIVITNWAKIVKFVEEALVELKKVSWTTRQDLIDATKVVIVSSIILGCFIAGVDFVLSKLLGILISR